MKIKTLVASSLLVAMLVLVVPAPRALADGAASTRNILLGVGAAAATLIIINHNKQVHAKYAADAANAAALASQRNDAQAAYTAEKRAYTHEAAVAEALKKEVVLKDRAISQQQDLIAQQKQQLAQLGIQSQPAAVAPASARKPAAMRMASMQMVSYGWGTL